MLCPPPLAFVQADKCGKRQQQPWRQFAALLEAAEKRWKNALLDLGGTIEGNCQQTVMNIWITEAIKDITSKGFQFSARHVCHRRDHFFKDQILHEAPQLWVFHRFAHRFDAQQYANRHH